MDKRVTIFFYGEGEAGIAKELVRQERAEQQVAMSREAASFSGEVEHCNRVVILEGVGAKRALIEAAFKGLIQPARGSSKWAGGPVNTEDHMYSVVADDPAAVERLRLNRGEDWVPPEPGRSNVEVVSYPGTLSEAQAQAIGHANPAALIREGEKVHAETLKVTGPKSDPEDVSLKMAETNLRPNLETEPQPTRPELPPPPRKAKRKKAKATKSRPAGAAV